MLSLYSRDSFIGLKEAGGGLGTNCMGKKRVLLRTYITCSEFSRSWPKLHTQHVLWSATILHVGSIITRISTHRQFLGRRHHLSPIECGYRICVYVLLQRHVGESCITHPACVYIHITSSSQVASSYGSDFHLTK